MWRNLLSLLRGRAGGEQALPLQLTPQILASAKRLEIRTRRFVTSELAGEYRSVFRGSGIEFAEAREYVPGDDIRLIDWNVTARMGAPWVKEYVEERELVLTCAVDISASQFAAKPEHGRLDTAGEVCALVMLSAVHNQDQTSLLTFSDRIERYVPPAKGTRHALRLVQEVLQSTQAQRATSLATVCDYLSHLLPRRSIIFLISDFIDENYEKSLNALARQHEVIAVSISDSLDNYLPNAGIVEVEDIELGGRLLIDSSDENLQHRYAEAAIARQENRSATLRAAGVDEIRVQTEGDIAQTILGFFRRRNGQS
jgi:uncharacterized protein (DUF58 family)